MQPAANAGYGKSIVESDLTSNPAISDWREIDEAKYRESLQMKTAAASTLSFNITPVVPKKLYGKDTNKGEILLM